jgi:carboxymethylenebutenolidase
LTTPIAIPSSGGSELYGCLAEPAGAGTAGAVVVVQEWWGLTPEIESKCDLFAAEGLLALAPDLFHGKRPANKAEAAQAMAALDTTNAVREIGDAVDRLRAHPRCNGKVAVTGFCMGGALTFAAACRLDGLAAAVAFYGLSQLPMEVLAKAKAPIQAHFAKRDDWAKASVAEQIQKAVRTAGGTMDLYVYEAGHAFMRASDPEVYEPESARVAWGRAIGFLGAHTR